MKNSEVKFKKFEEECRRYLYEKEVMKELERRFVKMNTSNLHFSDQVRVDPLKKYRFLESHIRHVDEVFLGLEKYYGSRISKIIKNEMIQNYSFDDKKELDKSYKNIVLQILNKNHVGVKV
jgi:hypothetical protein